MSDAYDAGYDLFKNEPELLLAEVWWRAAPRPSDERQEFVDGYRAARKQHDEFRREGQ